MIWFSRREKCHIGEGLMGNYFDLYGDRKPSQLVNRDASQISSYIFQNFVSQHIYVFRTHKKIYINSIKKLIHVWKCTRARVNYLLIHFGVTVWNWKMIVFAMCFRRGRFLLNLGQRKYLRSCESEQPCISFTYFRALYDERAQLFRDRQILGAALGSRSDRGRRENSRLALLHLEKILARHLGYLDATTFERSKRRPQWTITSRRWPQPLWKRRELVERVLPSVLRARVWPTCDDYERRTRLL